VTNHCCTIHTCVQVLISWKSIGEQARKCRGAGFLYLENKYGFKCRGMKHRLPSHLSSCASKEFILAKISVQAKCLSSSAAQLNIFLWHGLKNVLKPQTQHCCIEVVLSNLIAPGSCGTAIKIWTSADWLSTRKPFIHTLSRVTPLKCWCPGDRATLVRMKMKWLVGCLQLLPWRFWELLGQMFKFTIPGSFQADN